MNTSTKSLAAGFCVAGLLLAGCGSSSDGGSGSDGATSSQSSDEVTIDDAWARTSPMGTTTGVVYMEITAAADDELTGVSVSSDLAGSAEIHETLSEDEMSDDDMSETTMADDATTNDEMTDDDMTDDDMSGTMSMQEVDAVELPAGESVSFEPGGYHIMLLDLVEPLEAGQTVEVTLEFENAGTKTVSAEVRDA